MVSYEFLDSAVMSAQPANPVEETDFTGMDERQVGVNLEVWDKWPGAAAIALYLHTGIFL